jgi:hypothetical protein
MSLKIIEHPELGEICADCNEILFSQSVNEDDEIGRDYYCAGCDKSLRVVKPRIREANIEVVTSTPKHYTLDDIRRDYPRAYLKWSDDEIISSSILIAQNKTDNELVEIFERQPFITASRANADLSDYPQIDKSKAVHLLGSKIVCGVCQHKTTLTYGLLEKISIKSTIRIIEISRDVLVDNLKRLKCLECNGKQARLSEW